MPGGQVMSAPPSGRRPVKKSKGKQCTGANARVRLCRASAERRCRAATVCKNQAFAKLLRNEHGPAERPCRTSTVCRTWAFAKPLWNTVARTGYTGQKSFVESGQWEAAMPNDKRRCTRGGAALSRSDSLQKTGLAKLLRHKTNMEACGVHLSQDDSLQKLCRNKATPGNDMHET